MGIIGSELKLEERMTRADAAKLICGMLAFDGSVDAQLNYSDVTKENSAYPYIAYVSVMGITEGYDDGTFKPDKEVTAGEFVKMLVCAIGYGVYAENLGGYPNGYTAYADRVSITEGVVLLKDDVITYETALKLAYNTLDVPLLVIDGYSFDEAGTVAPEYKILDGDDFRSLRTAFEAEK